MRNYSVQLPLPLPNSNQRHDQQGFNKAHLLIEKLMGKFKSFNSLVTN